MLGQAGAGPALIGFPSLGQAGSGPALMCLWARLILAHPLCLGQIWPRLKREIRWAEIGPTFLGLSPAQLVGRPGPAHLVLYIIYYIVFVLFIYL